MSVVGAVAGLLCFALTAQAAKQKQKTKSPEKGGGSTGEMIFRGSVTQINPARFVMTVRGTDVVVGEPSGAAPKPAGEKNPQQPPATKPTTQLAPQDRQFFINASCRVSNGQDTVPVSSLKPGTGVDVSFPKGSAVHYTAAAISITRSAPAATAPAKPARSNKKNK